MEHRQWDPRSLHFLIHSTSWQSLQYRFKCRTACKVMSNMENDHGIMQRSLVILLFMDMRFTKYKVYSTRFLLSCCTDLVLNGCT